MFYIGIRIKKEKEYTPGRKNSHKHQTVFFLLLPESLKVWPANIQPRELRWFYEPNGNIDREFRIFLNER